MTQSDLLVVESPFSPAGVLSEMTTVPGDPETEQRRQRRCACCSSHSPKGLIPTTRAAKRLVPLLSPEIKEALDFHWTGSNAATLSPVFPSGSKRVFCKPKLRLVPTLCACPQCVGSPVPQKARLSRRLLRLSLPRLRQSDACRQLGRPEEPVWNVSILTKSLWSMDSEQSDRVRTDPHESQIVSFLQWKCSMRKQDAAPAQCTCCPSSQNVKFKG